MAQQVFPQWSPVVKAHNEDQQEVYIPAAIIHAQTRDGKDELIVGAANMQFDPETGDYLPTHAGNPVEVRARALETLLQTLGKEETLALVKSALDVLVSKDFATQTTLAAVLEKLADLATESTLAQSVDKLNSILSRLEGKLDTAIFDSQGNPISAANRLPVEATLSGQIVEHYNGAEVVRTKEIGKAYRTHFFMDSEYVEVAAGAFVDDSEILSVNGFSTLAVLLRVQSTSRDIRVRARWYSGNAEPFAAGSAYEDL